MNILFSMWGCTKPMKSVIHCSQQSAVSPYYLYGKDGRESRIDITNNTDFQLWMHTWIPVNTLIQSWVMLDLQSHSPACFLCPSHWRLPGSGVQPLRSCRCRDSGKHAGHVALCLDLTDPRTLFKTTFPSCDNVFGDFAEPFLKIYFR